MPDTSTPQALLFVFGECGPYATEEEFNDWYDNEHAPARLTVKGFSSAVRYKAIDAQQPTWLALYDLSTTEVMSSDGYKALRTNASQREVDVVSRLRTLDRRVYKHLSTLEHHPEVQRPAKWVRVVSMEPSREGEAEFNQWYEEEHMAMLSKVPGWLRGRRYTLVSQTDRAGRAEKPSRSDGSASDEAAPKYLAIHEVDRHDYMELEEFQAAVSTPWRKRVMSEIVLRRESRTFELHRDFGPPVDHN